MMKADVKFRYWLTCAVAAGWQMEEGEYQRPLYVGSIATPETLDSLTFGQLVRLSHLGESNSIFYDVCQIILGMDAAAVNEARALDVVTLCGWVTQEVNKINGLFKKLSTKPTEQERRAGIDKLNFGLFGLMDRYARRMGIHNHDDVEAVPWIRVYRCVEIDNETDKFQKRYMEITQDDYRRKNSKHSR